MLAVLGEDSKAALVSVTLLFVSPKKTVKCQPKKSSNHYDSATWLRFSILVNQTTIKVEIKFFLFLSMNFITAISNVECLNFYSSNYKECYFLQKEY